MITETQRRQDFPSLRKVTYLNTAAEGIPPRCVGEALEEYWAHKLKGMRGRDDHFARRDQCRKIAAKWVHLSPSEVSFCSCSSEACNLLATALNLKPSDEVVVNDLEFPSSVTPWMASATPATMRLWKSRDGALAVDDLVRLLNRRTRLVAVSLVSFYNGNRLPWYTFAKAVRANAPRAILSVDLTQALGRCVFDCSDADFLFASTHKWILALHGGCVVGVPERSAGRLAAHAGGWYNIANAFEADQFQRAEVKRGAAGFSVGMPSFAPIYGLNAALRYLDGIGVARIASHADPLVESVHRGLIGLGLKPMAPLSGSGIVAFRHPRSTKIHAALEKAGIEVMHHAGRLRISLHGYNTSDDVDHLLGTLARILGSP